MKKLAFYTVNTWKPLFILERIKGLTRGWGSLIMRVYLIIKLRETILKAKYGFFIN